MSKPRKIGFYWFNEGGLCDGSQVTHRQAWWGGEPFYLESVTIFLGAEPAPPGQGMDLNVQLAHSDGNMIVGVGADRYQPSSGIADVTFDKVFRTPWVFNPGDALMVTPYGLGPRVNGQYLRWGVGIIVEGYLE